MIKNITGKNKLLLTGKLEKRHGIAITKLVDKRCQPGFIIWKFTTFYQISQPVTKNAPEIFVARIRQERPGIGKHPHHIA